MRRKPAAFCRDSELTAFSTYFLTFKLKLKRRRSCELGTLCALRRRYLVAGERCEKRALVCVYDLITLKAKKTMAFSDCQSTRFVSAAFSGDGRLLLTLSGPPDWQLVYWVWEKASVLAACKARLLEASREAALRQRRLQRRIGWHLKFLLLGALCRVAVHASLRWKSRVLRRSVLVQ